MKIFTFFLMAVLMLAVSPTLSAASTPASNHPEGFVETLTPKQLRKYERRQKRMEKLTEKIAHRIDKITKKKGNQFLDDLDPNLRLAVIFGLAALALSLLGIFAVILYVFAGIAAIIAAVFFVLWLAENA